MMKRNALIIVLVLLFFPLSLAAQKLQLAGSVTDKTTGSPVEFATVILEGSGQWAVADAKGAFSIKNVDAGKHVISVSCLGYVSDSKEVTLSKDVLNYKVMLSPDNLALEGATVTAKEESNSSTTARTIDRTALDHVQIMSVSDIASLLPGGSTTNPSLTSSNNFTLHSASGENGNTYFGTAIEVDGVRLSNNGSFEGASSTSTSLKGASTNNIASSNVESIEVISGVASVEYGDMTSGVVKINTKRGKTPLTVTMSTTPNNKQLSVSKGMALRTGKGKSAGVLNASAEYTRSISEPMSPFKSYDRKQASLTWTHTLTNGLFSESPLKLSVGATGNLGSYNTLADPDTFKDSYSKANDNALRGNVSLNWLLNRSWITNVEFNGSISYSDKSSEDKTYYSSSTSVSALHGTEQGYHISESYSESTEQFIVRIPAGYWSNVMNCDDRPLYFKAGLKANWARNFGKVSNKVKLGTDLSGDKNFGVGQYSSQMATAPSFREYRYCDIPWMVNAAAYIENTLTAPIGKGKLLLVTGLRNDNTIVNGSEYGNTSSLSPRASAKYTVFDSKSRRGKTLRSLAFKAAWGKSVKLPSFAILYPEPSYYDVEVFRSAAASDNTVTSAYYTLPRKLVYNSNLKFQSNTQTDFGVNMELARMKIDLSAYYTITENAYRMVADYEPYTYNYTNASVAASSSIPSGDRLYSVNPVSGIISITDRTGTHPTEQIATNEKKQFVSYYETVNDSNPIKRYGLEWSLEFPKIKAVNTTIKLDGNFYGYRSLLSDMRAYTLSSSTSASGGPYKYVGYFYGSQQQYNGTMTRTLKNNITVVTQVPKVRMIVSLKLEAGLLKYSQALTERADGSRRSYALKEKNDILSITEDPIYGREGYYVVFPDYYVSLDNPTEKRDYLEDLKWAKANDSALFSDLSKMANVTNYNYIFKTDNISPYFCANFSVTKEIGDMASISFYANNFFNNTAQVYSKKTGNYSSVTSYIPAFYYGLTLRLKF